MTAQIPPLPTDLADAQAQAVQAIQAAIEAGYSRIQVDILVPDIKPEILAYPFITICDPPFSIVFSDAGAAALAQRDWTALGEMPEGSRLQSIGPSLTVTPETAILFVMPSVYSLDTVEQICDSVSKRGQNERPIILLNPQLQDAATVGVGLAGRRIRERFISTFEPSYYLRSLGAGALTRFYPHPWCIWEQTETGDYTLLDTRSTQPTGEELGEIFAQSSNQSPGIFDGLRRFIRALQR